jgi:hypothetical protein
MCSDGAAYLTKLLQLQKVYNIKLNWYMKMNDEQEDGRGLFDITRLAFACTV